jgi:hypothetical protein
MIAVIGRWRGWVALAAAGAAGIFLWSYVSQILDIPPTAISPQALTRLHLAPQKMGGSKGQKPVAVLGVTLETA